ncbi:hypothetical protein B0H13DRAFT_1917730 [Mycena leptocephala]|nr:hypothetical protein B0H13DRAFT_1917730 [Mycena leptocephala]
MGKYYNYFLRSSLLAEGRFPNAPTPFRTFSSLDSNTAFHLSRDHVGRQLTVDAAATKFRLPDFRPALAAYLHRKQGNQLIIGGKRPNLRDDTLLFDKIEYWNNVRIQSRSFHDANKILVPETVNAAPPDGHWKSQSISGCTVDLQVQRFDIVPQMRGGFPEPASGMYQLKRARRVDQSIMGDIIPLDRLRMRVELTPHFGKMADRRLKKVRKLRRGDYRTAWRDFDTITAPLADGGRLHEHCAESAVGAGTIWVDGTPAGSDSILTTLSTSLAALVKWNPRTKQTFLEDLRVCESDEEIVAVLRESQALKPSCRNCQVFGRRLSPTCIDLAILMGRKI